MIVDDEKYSRESVKELISGYESFEVVAESSSAEDAIGKIRKFKPQVIFLDIQLSGISGLELAKTLKKSECMIVFISAYDEYALQAFEVNAIDYVTKPISPSRFEVTVQKIENNFRSLFPTVEKIPVKNEKTIDFVDVEDICYIEEIGKDAIIHTLENEHTLKRNTLTSLQEKLPDNFLRVHKSYIVNTRKVLKMKKHLGNWEMLMECEEYVPISKNLLKYVKELFDL
jgi:two-component system response regulator LytT